MKSLLVIVALSCMTLTAFAAPKCTLEIDEFTMMPQGAVDTPISVIQILKAKGYTAKITPYPSASQKGEFTTSPKVECSRNVFNPWVTLCTTKMRVRNHLDQVVAEGVNGTTMNFGAYGGNLDEAAKDLPDCKDL